VAAILNLRADSPVTVETDMGRLLVRWEPGSEVVLIGPSQFICAGQYVDPE
jgi:diaminopimelate epimerase